MADMDRTPQDVDQESPDGNKEFENLGRRGRPAEAWIWLYFELSY